MLFNSSIAIYQPSKEFLHGEVDSTYASAGTLYCHIKFTGTEPLSADRKKSIRRAKITFEDSPVDLAARDILVIGGANYRLLYAPTPRVGLANRTIYEVEIAEDFKVELS